MSFIKFEMLSIMQTLHSIGLMPDDAYERERERLVLLLRSDNWSVKLHGGRRWKNKGSIFHLPDPTDDLDTVSPKEQVKTTFDWRVLVADLLQAAYEEPSEDVEYIESEMCHLQVRPHRDCKQTTTASLLLSRSRSSSNDIDRLQGPHGPIEALRSEIEELREEVRKLRQRDATGRGSPEPSVKRDIPIAAPNAAEIAQLQEELAQCHMNAIRLEGEGEHFFAGDWRGKAAALESRLRALGA